MIAASRVTADSRIFQQARSLRHAGYDVTLLVAGGPGELALEVIEGIQVHRIVLSTGAGERHAAECEFPRRAGAHAAGLPIDVIHAVGIPALSAAVQGKVKRRAKLVYDANPGPEELAVRQRGLRRALARASLLLVSDADATDRYRDLAPSVPVHAVQTRFPRIDCPPSLALPRRLGLGPRHRLLLVPVGERSEAGLRSLAVAARHLPPEVHLVLAGYGPQQERTASWVRRAAGAGLGERCHLAWFDSRDELIRWGVGARLGCVVESSSPERDVQAPLLPLLHCLAARLPAVVPDSPPFRPLARRYECLRPVDLGDRWALRRALLAMMADGEPRRQLVAAARKAAECECWETEAAVLLAAYRRHVGPARVPAHAGRTPGPARRPTRGVRA
jgi:glycosyltransferase involved in cell wall biosynthesis